MKRRTILRCGAAIVFAAALQVSCEKTHAAMIITAFNSPMTENFDTFAGTAATVPVNFTWTPDGIGGSTTGVDRGLFDTATTAYTNNNGLYALLYSSNSATDRAFGTKRQPNTNPDILAWSFVNQTGT